MQFNNKFDCKVVTSEIGLPSSSFKILQQSWACFEKEKQSRSRKNNKGTAKQFSLKWIAK